MASIMKGLVWCNAKKLYLINKKVIDNINLQNYYVEIKYICKIAHLLSTALRLIKIYSNIDKTVEFSFQNFNFC